VAFAVDTVMIPETGLWAVITRAVGDTTEIHIGFRLPDYIQVRSDKFLANGECIGVHEQ